MSAVHQPLFRMSMFAASVCRTMPLTVFAVSTASSLCGEATVIPLIGIPNWSSFLEMTNSRQNSANEWTRSGTNNAEWFSARYEALCKRGESE